MTKLTDFDQAMLKAAKALARLQRIREGIETFEPDDVMGVRHWRPAPKLKTLSHIAVDATQKIPFHKPVARSVRLTNAAGATSFTFQHRRVNKVTRQMVQDGFRNRPGAARAHSRYIERDAAVAQLAPEFTPHADQAVAVPEIGYANAETTTVHPANSVVTHDKYIARTNAVAIQPDGTRALLTNIDHDDDERARFWTLVEEHEAVASRDQIIFRFNDAPGFWKDVAVSPGCPAPLHKALKACDPDKAVTLEIQSGKELRRFLEQIAASSRDSGATKVPARFRDGRKGRTQYRIVGELPNELTPDERFAIVREFAQKFEERKLPFVAVMHAPDHLNDEKNWHFHLDYYDRPCRRIDARDISELAAKGFSTDRLRPGMWDFAVILPKRGRTNGRSTPLRQNKVSEVSGKSWLKQLRISLADITNQHMAAAGHDRRVDPRSFSEMGIMADPQEHLGSHSAIAESKGQVTAKGTENEKRQWAAIMAQADQRLQLALSNVDVRVANFEQQRRTPDKSEAAVKDAAAALRQNLTQTALMEDTAFRLEQSLERARSRALKVRRSNTRLLKALEADPASATEREKRDTRELVSAAANYLALLGQKLNDEYALLAQCVGIARRASIAAAMVEQSSVGKALASRQRSVGAQPIEPEPTDNGSVPAGSTRPSGSLAEIASRTLASQAKDHLTASPPTPCGVASANVDSKLPDAAKFDLQRALSRLGR